MRSTAVYSPDSPGRTVRSLRRRWFFRVIRGTLAVGSGTKTDLMYASRINSQQLKRYLTFLISNGLLQAATSRENRAEYAITQRGENALSKLQEIISLLGVD